MFFLPSRGAHSTKGFDAVEKDGEYWLKCYNATASTVTAGTMLYFKHVQSDVGLVEQIVALVGDALKHVVGVVDNDMKSTKLSGTTGGDIAATSWGFIKVKGRVTATTASITTVKGDSLKITTGAVAAAGSALPYTDTTFAIADEASGPATSHTFTLLGREFLASA